MWVAKILKGILVFVLSFIFVSLLFVTSSVFIFGEVTNEDVIKPVLTGMLSAMRSVGGQDNEETQQNLLLLCENEGEVELPIVDKEGKEQDTIKINCEDLRQGKPLQDILSEHDFKKIYHAEMSCDFLDCFSQESEFPPIFTKKAHDFFNAVKYKILIALIAAGILLLLVGGISVAARNLVVAGLPAIPLLLGKGFISKGLAGSQMEMFLPVAEAILPLSTRIFSGFFAAGIILFVVSLILGKRKAKPEKPAEKPEKKPSLWRTLIPVRAVARKRAKQRKKEAKERETERFEKKLGRKGVKVIRKKKKGK